MNDTDAPDEVRCLAQQLLKHPFDRNLANAILAALPEERQLASFITFILTSLLQRDHSGVFWGDRLLTIDKSCGFLADPVFAACMERIRGSHEYDAYNAPHGIAWRIHTLCWAGRQALALPTGDFVECGVFKGDMAWCVSQVCGIPASGRSFYLYDSFSGFDPRLSGEEEIPSSPGYFSFANAYYKQDNLYESVSGRFSSMRGVKVIRGIIPDVFDAHPPPDKIAYLHIDLNSPTSERCCLERLFNNVVDGGIIVFDDYGWKIFSKQKESADEFFQQIGLRVLETPTGQGIVVKTTSSS